MEYIEDPKFGVGDIVGLTYDENVEPFLVLDIIDIVYSNFKGGLFYYYLEGERQLYPEYLLELKSKRETDSEAPMIADEEIPKKLMFTSQDLLPFDIIVTRDGKRYLYSDRGKLLGKGECVLISEYYPDLLHKKYKRKDNGPKDIIEIYRGTDLQNLDLESVHLPENDRAYKEKFNPSCGETYYHCNLYEDNLVTKTTWTDNDYDKIRRKRGIMFATEKEAIAASNKMLRSLK